jgi:VTC domain-containing protein
MAPDRLLSSRFEMKYLICEEEAARVREFVRAYMELDDHGVGRVNFSYPVHSLYLDSEDLKLYWKTINGEKNRYKLRIRFYNDDPAAPVFFEVKRRHNNCIIKHRAAIWRQFTHEILAGQVPPRVAFAAYNEKQEAAVLEFIELMGSIDATPRAHVAYFREAYLPADGNTARVTLDRAVRIEPQFNSRLFSQMRDPTLIWRGPVILELKFTDRYPLWFREMVEACGLIQCSAAKYVAGIELLGEHRFSEASRVLQFEEHCELVANRCFA